MSLQKKEYYNKILEGSKNNIQQTWKVISHIIRNRCYKSEFLTYFVNSSGSIGGDLKSNVCYVNDYFVCVGTDVASKIKVPGDKTDSFNNLITVNSK